MIEEQVDPNIQLLRMWREAKTEAKNADERADAILNGEIVPAMEDGEFFSDGDMCLVFEFSQTPRFDAARALKEGAITKEVFDAYTSVSVVRKTMYRKKDEDGKQAEQRKLTALKAVAEQFKK
jgi:hypothetical protein